MDQLTTQKNPNPARTSPFDTY
ncbi:MAG: hypothetical protein XD77_1442, partial [Marinimicrobia bacterium 46_47]